MSAVATRLAALLGEERLGDASDPAGRVVGGRTPEVVVSPTDAEQVAELLRWAAAEGVGVVPMGRGRFLGGRRPAEPFVAVTTSGLRGIESYEPADLTLIAGAGTTLADLRARLEPEEQWCPFDPPGGDARTLGGIVASGHRGPLAAGYGAPRDHLLGATVVTGDGRVLRLGGRVVKNVAGFDLLRLMVGSRGTLGVVVSACVRVFPLPARELVLSVEAARSSELLAAATALATAPVVPAASTLAWSVGGPARLVVRLHGAAGQVDAERAAIERHLGSSLAADEAASASVDETGREIDGSAVSARLTVLPDNVDELATAVSSRVREGTPVIADPLAGTVRLGLSEEDADPSDDGPLASLRSAADALGGALSVEGARLPSDFDAVRSRVPGGVAELEHAMRGAFDPAGVLWRGAVG